MRKFRVAVFGLLALVLSACSGGGGGGDRQPTPPSVSIVPANLQASFLTGHSVPLTIIATPSAAIDQNVFVTIVDTVGVLAPTLSIVQNDATSYRVELATSAGLQPDRYTGTLTANVCFDQACARPFRNSPLSIPYDFTVNPLPPALLTNDTITGTYTAGFPFAARVQYSEPRGQYFALSKTADVLEREITFASFVPGTLIIRPLPSLAPGRYTGTVEVQACDFPACATAVRDVGPASIPFDITVTPLAALGRQTGVADWSMFQGDATHRGHVAITIDVNKIKPRWYWSNPDSVGFLTAVLHPLVIADNRIFAAVNIGSLRALREDDASLIWSRDFRGNDLWQLSPPTATNGRVYLQTTALSSTVLWGLDAANGGELLASPIANQSSRFLAPTVKDGVVYTQGGSSGGIYGHNGTTGEEVFFTDLPQSDLWAPAVDDQYAYAYMRNAGELIIVDRITGQLVDEIVPSSGSGTGEYAAAILGVPGSVIAVPVSLRGTNQVGALTRFDIPGRTVTWTNFGAYVGAPAYADEVIYAVNNDPLRLEARAEVDGALLWSWDPPQGGAPDDITFMSDVLVTDNLVFVSTNAGTYAIDRTTHQSVWSYPQFGSVAISANGILYISYGDIVAFDTR
jgi:outer membrane protein assembly factor BamB